MASNSRVYQLLMEVYAAFTGFVRSTQVMVENSVSATDAEVRSTQVMIEDTNYASAAEVRTTQVMIEVIIGQIMTLSCDSPPDGVVGVPYSHALVVVGGTAPYTYTLVLGSLPPGLTLNPTTGVISGTPTTEGTYPFTVQVNDSGALSAQANCSITIFPSTLNIDCDNPPTGTVGVPYSHFMLATGGTAPYTFSIILGALPDGLSLDTGTGEISGTPTLAGTFVFTVRVTDADLSTADVQCSITIVGEVALDCDSPPDGTVGIAYSHFILVSGGQAPYLFTISAGALPDGLTLNGSTGEISGTPTTAGTFAFTVFVTDGLGNTASVDCSITILEALAASCGSPPPATFGVPYSHQIVVTGGTPPYTFTIIFGALPPGLSLDPVTGIISGTPTQQGTFGFTIQVTVSDGSGQIVEVTCSVDVNPPSDTCPEEDQGGPG